MKTTTKSHSYDQHKLKVLCDALCDNIEQVLEHFGIDEYKKSDKMITMKCPIHDGDNISALNLYYEGDQYRGNWICRTHNCEKIFKNSIIGFIRGLMSHQKLQWSQYKDPVVTFDDAVDYCVKLVSINLSDIEVSGHAKNKAAFYNTIKHICSRSEKNYTKISPELIQKTLKIPGKYFLNRGFTPEILHKYDVGLCDNPSKEMYNRCVVPIYDADHSYMVGCTGRSIFEACVDCGLYHESPGVCPTDNLWRYAKWKHSFGFKAESSLYNIWFAKEHIAKTFTIILVESPGNVWRLEEAGINNSVAIFGSSLSDKQKMLIDASGAMNIIILTDNDDAGHKAAQQIIAKCSKTYNIYRPPLDFDDIACMTVSQVKQIITPILDKIL